MTFGSSKSSVMRLALAALVVLGLIGGLLHHHASDSDCGVCALCHAGVQTPAGNLAATLAAPRLASVEQVAPVRPDPVRSNLISQTLVPRAPPALLNQ